MSIKENDMFLKKIKKLFKSPLKFFTQSMWLSLPFFDNKVVNGNVIVVTTLGQLNQAESLIKFNKINDPSLVIMYTTQNMRMPNLIYKTVNKKLFRSIFMYELPLKPGNVSLKKYLYMKKGYVRLVDELKPKDLYVMSFSGHYTILLNYAKKQGSRLHLIEEGTATYAPLSDSFNIKLSKAEYFFQKKHISNDGYFNNFDELHVSFPDYGEKIFKAKEYNYFLAHMSGVNLTPSLLKIQDKYNVTSNDYIYVSQMFPVDDNLYYSTIISFLEEVLKNISGKVFIKLHPKEMERRRIMQMFLEKSKDNSRLIVFNEPPFLIDPFIYLTEPRGIIGITSTALAYAPLLVPNIEAISIANLIIDKLRAENQNVYLIESHLKILKIYPFINIVDSTRFLDNLIKYSPKLDFSELILKAEESYKNKKYYHAIFYWRLAFRNDVSLLGNKSLWYYNALNKVGQVYKMKKEEIRYIDNIKDFNKKDVDIWNNIKKSFNG